MTRALLPWCLDTSTPYCLNVTCCITGLPPPPDLGAGTTKTPRRVLQAVIVIITDCRCYSCHSALRVQLPSGPCGCVFSYIGPLLLVLLFIEFCGARRLDSPWTTQQAVSRRSW